MINILIAINVNKRNQFHIRSGLKNLEIFQFILLLLMDLKNGSKIPNVRVVLVHIVNKG